MTWRPWTEGDGDSCLNMRWIAAKGFAVRCGQCSRCRVLRGKDWAGRAIAESMIADRTLFVTLTVGGDRMYCAGIAENIRAKEFHREDVVGYIKRLRRYIRGRGDKTSNARMRVFWVGENGDRKGRVHYHLVLYLYNSKGPPDLLLDTYYFHGKMDDGLVEAYPSIVHQGGTLTFWPHGTSYYLEFAPKHAYYLASYVTKVFRSEDGEAERVFYTRPGVSTKPLLGAEWFKLFALRHVEQRVVPQDRTYSFGREPGYSGHVAKYWMGNAAWRLFLRAFVTYWRQAYGEEPWPYSPEVEVSLEAIADEIAGKRPYDWEVFDERMEHVIKEKTEFRSQLGMVRHAREEMKFQLDLAKAGVKPYVKRDGVDDAYNHAVVIRDKPGQTIAEQEAEWARMFGTFEDHERRWQAEVLHKKR